MRIDLPSPDPTGDLTLNESIANRRTIREYSDGPVTLEQLSQLLWSAQGVTGTEGQRAAPSAGGQYPIHVLVTAGNVEDLPAGTYRYCSREHSLEREHEDDVRPALATATIGEQSWVEHAAVILALVADLPPMQQHFFEQPPRGARGERYVYMESGAIVQNVHLQATGPGLGVVLVGGFDDEDVARVLGLGEGMRATALVCVGVAAGA